MGALFVAAVVTIVLAAQAGLAFCSHRIAVPLPDAICGGHLLHTLPTFDGPSSLGTSTFELCPMTIALIVFAAAVTGWALFTLSRDRYADLTTRLLLRSLAALPVRPSAAVLTVASAVPLGLMFIASPTSSFTVVAVLTLLAITFGTALAATLLLTLCARSLVVLAQRVAVVLLTALGLAGAQPVRPVLPLMWALLTPADVAVLATSRGLRAPPSRVP